MSLEKVMATSFAKPSCRLRSSESYLVPTPIFPYGVQALQDLGLRVADANDMRREAYTDKSHFAAILDSSGNTRWVDAPQPISELVSRDMLQLAQREGANILPYVRKEVPQLNCDILDFECEEFESPAGKQLLARVSLKLSLLLYANAQYQKRFLYAISSPLSPGMSRKPAKALSRRPTPMF